MQTDRQTDKATHWQITAFAEDMTKLLACKDNIMLPDFIKIIYGGVEECPQTKRLHFQGHIVCRRQVRFSQLKKEFPKAHLEPARDINKSIAYAMKKDTAVSEKTKITNKVEFTKTGQILKDLAQALINKYSLDDPDLRMEFFIKIGEDKSPAKKISDLYWEGVCDIISNDSALLDEPGQFARADVRQLWQGCWRVYLEKGISISITDIPPGNTIHKPEPSIHEIISRLSINGETSPTSESI